MGRSLAALLTVLIVGASGIVQAQILNLTAYRWEAADLALAYPAAWDAPVESEQEGRLTLELSQTLAGQAAARPPGIPTIVLTMLPAETAGQDLAAALAAAFDRLGTAPVAAVPETLAGRDGLAAEGNSPDGALFALGRAAFLADGRLLVAAGRAAEAGRAAFTSVFEAVVGSLVVGGAAPVLPAYGPLWQTIRTLGDGEQAFVNLVGLAYAGGQLFTADANLGVVQLDAASGAVVAVHPNPRLGLPSGVAADAAAVYVADSVCGCIWALNPTDGDWTVAYEGFGSDAPASLVLAPNGLYATSQTGDGLIQVRAFQTAGEAVIPLGDDFLAQPLLAVDPSGRVLALDADGRVYALAADGMSLAVELNVGGALVNAWAVDAGGGYWLATEGRAVLAVGPDGEPAAALGRIVANYPLPGEVVSPRGVAVGPDGTVYIADSDGAFGAVTALSTRVQAGRIGAARLVPGAVVQGALNGQTPAQDWTFSGAAGQWITLSAVDTGGGALDVALRLVAPDGRDEIYNDDQAAADLPNPTDAQIAGHRLAQTGVYQVWVERVSGSGTYRLALSPEQPFSLAESVTRLRGSLPDALPVQRWMFEGRAGSVLTITMQAVGGTLDPLLRLLDGQGRVLAENDDAADPALGKDAQLFQVRLPADGSYVLEARRFAGDGDYTLVIVETAG